MFKKLREKIYNKKIEKELRSIEQFDYVYNEMMSIYPSFVSHTDNGKETFRPQTIYAVKRAIQKLSNEYVQNNTSTYFEFIIRRMFSYAGFDKSRIKECLNLFNSRKQNLNKNEKSIVTDVKNNEELIER